MIISSPSPFPSPTAYRQAGAGEVVRGNSSPIEIRVLFILCKFDKDVLQIDLS
jgi:hypothetical protein